MNRITNIIVPAHNSRKTKDTSDFFTEKQIVHPSFEIFFKRRIDISDMD